MRKSKTFLDIANRLGSLSTCDRGSIGAVIVKEGRCISWGYNGAPGGLPHCSENNHGRAIPKTGKIEYPPETEARMGCDNATHAEANAIAAAARQGISTDSGELFVSTSPCVTCSRLIISAGIRTIFYDIPYREIDGVKLLLSAGCDVWEWDDAEAEFQYPTGC